MRVRLEATPKGGLMFLLIRWLRSGRGGLAAHVGAVFLLLVLIALPVARVAVDGWSGFGLIPAFVIVALVAWRIWTAVRRHAPQDRCRDGLRPTALPHLLALGGPCRPIDLRGRVAGRRGLASREAGRVTTMGRSPALLPP
jgi:hypothetical protein